MTICQPFILSDLALQLSLVIHTPGLWLQENGNISSLSCVTEVYHAYHHQVHHIQRVTHSRCNRATDTLSESRVWHRCIATSLQSKVILALVVKTNELFNARRPGQLVLQNVPQAWAREWFNRDWPVVHQMTQQHAERSLAFNTCDRSGQV